MLFSLDGALGTVSHKANKARERLVLIYILACVIRTVIIVLTSRDCPLLLPVISGRSVLTHTSVPKDSVLEVGDMTCAAVKVKDLIHIVAFCLCLA